MTFSLRAGANVDRSAWRALIAAWVGWLFDGYESYAFVLVMPVAVRQLVQPEDPDRIALYAGAAVSAMLVGWATGGVIAGILADYIGRKRTLMLSILWYSLFTGITALVPSYRALVVCRALTGVGLGAEWGAGTAIVAECWPTECRGRAAGVLQSGFGAGFFLASVTWLVVGRLGSSSWRYLFLIGILPAFGLLYMRRGLQDSTLWLARDRRQLARTRERTKAIVEPEDATLTVGALWSDPTLRRRTVLLTLMSLSTVVGWWSVSSWIPDFAGQVAAKHHLDARWWTSVVGLTYNAGAMAGYIAFGIIADAWGRKPAIVVYYLGALALSLLLFLTVTRPFALLVVSCVNGFFTLGQFSWMAVYLPELFPTAVRSSAISLVFNVSRYAAAIGPLAAGWLISATRDISRPAAAISLIYVVGLLVTPIAGRETLGTRLPA